MRILLVSASACHLLELVSDVRLQPDACLLPLTAFSCLILPRPCGTVQRHFPKQVAVSACAPVNLYGSHPSCDRVLDLEDYRAPSIWPASLFRGVPSVDRMWSHELNVDRSSLLFQLVSLGTISAARPARDEVELTEDPRPQSGRRALDSCSCLSCA